MDPSYIFSANARWTQGRRGIADTEPPVEAIDFSAPPEFRGEAGSWSPEHLLLAAVASCFVITFRGIAELSKFEFDSLDVRVDGTIEKAEGGLQFTTLLLKPNLGLLRDGDGERALRLLYKTERSCLISRSLKCATRIEPLIHVSSLERAPEQQPAA